MKTSLAKVLIALLLCLLGIPRLNGTQDKTSSERTIRDKDLKLVDFEDLTYPALGRTAHIQGVVVIRAKLNDQGKVVDATAISGSDVLIPASIENAKGWRFQPNPQGAAIIVYNFRLTDAVSKSGCSHFTLQAPNFATITSCVSTIQ
jgi:outer membrane biosynthesis protein TonB